MKVGWVRAGGSGAMAQAGALMLMQNHRSEDEESFNAVNKTHGATFSGRKKNCAVN